MVCPCLVAKMLKLSLVRNAILDLLINAWVPSILKESTVNRKSKIVYSKAYTIFPLIQQNKCIAKEKVCDIWEIFYVISIAEEFQWF